MAALALAAFIVLAVNSHIVQRPKPESYKHEYYKVETPYVDTLVTITEKPNGFKLLRRGKRPKDYYTNR